MAYRMVILATFTVDWQRISLSWPIDSPTGPLNQQKVLCTDALATLLAPRNFDTLKLTIEDGSFNELYPFFHTIDMGSLSAWDNNTPLKLIQPVCCLSS